MRQKININKDWYFSKTICYPNQVKIEDMELINIPHTWNNVDGTDGGDDYYRGKCVYFKKLNNIDFNKENEEVYLEFDGANMSATIFVNSHLVGTHHGGYSRFRFNISQFLKEKDNTLFCYVDNEKNRTVYPQKADFTFYGGIYRDVNILIVNKAHFSLNYYGGDGLKVTPNVNGEVEIEGYFENANNQEVTFQIFNSEGNIVDEVNSIIKDNYAKVNLHVKNVNLWDGINNPYLYQVKGLLNDDEVKTKIGFRSYEIDSQKGFILNGKPYNLIGVSRHQDREGVGSALTKDMHKEDLDLIKEMGATTIRLAHYQHDQYVYDLADEYGFILWAEIPYISEHMPEGKDNTISQFKELIIQNYNHPSIIVWGISNEITAVNAYFDDCLNNHRRLNDLAHKLDKSRPTTMANLFMLESSSELVKLPDVRSYNLYFGWYTGEKEDNDKWFDEFHSKYPDLAIGLSEYGADANPKYQSIEPIKGDYSETYQALYHEHMMKMRLSRPWIWATHVWNMFDFAADARDEGGKKGLNQKGLVTFDRKIKKDAFYLYKAYLSREKFVHLCGKRYVKRTGENTVIKVYSNLDNVSLYVDEKLFENKKGKVIFEFNIPLNSKHHIKAVSGECYDEFDIEKVEQEYSDYVCPTRMEVVNWFEETTDLNPEYFSIRDKVKDIKNHPVAGAIYNKMMLEAMKSMGDVAKSFTMPKEMQEKMDEMTLEDNLKMAGHMVSGSVVKSLNKVLQGVKK